MQGSLEGADGGRNRRVHVRESGGRHPSHEGRGVKAVVGMQNEGDVKPAGVFGGRHLAGEHVEEIRGKVELWVRRDGVLTVANSSKRRCDGADLAGEAQRLALVRLN